MPVKDFLSQKQEEQLQQALQESNCPQERERILMLLLMNDGKTFEQISDFIGGLKRPVAYKCVHSEPEDLESVQNKREQGNHRHVTAAYIQLLLEIINNKPEELAYKLGSYTRERLTTYLGEQTGIELSSVQVRRVVGWCFHTWAAWTASEWEQERNFNMSRRLRSRS
jgi:transposase